MGSITTSSNDVIGQSICSLRHLSLLPENREKIVIAQALQPFTTACAGAKAADDSEILREVAACVCLLSLTDKLRMPIANSVFLTCLMELCSSTDTEIARQACGAVANLAENKKTHKILINVG